MSDRRLTLLVTLALVLFIPAATPAAATPITSGPITVSCETAADATVTAGQDAQIETGVRVENSADDIATFVEYAIVVGDIATINKQTVFVDTNESTVDNVTTDVSWRFLRSSVDPPTTVPISIQVRRVGSSFVYETFECGSLDVEEFTAGGAR